MTSERQARNRSEILAEAARLIARHGFHGLTMRALARATGHSLANLYNYVPSKDALLFEVQARAFETLIDTAERALRGARPPDARLHAFIYNHVRYVAAHPDVLRVLVQEAGALRPAARRTVRRLKQRYFELGLGLVSAVAAGTEDALPGVELERATYSVFGMLNWVYGWYDAAAHGSPEDVARSIHALAIGGLVARRPRPEDQRAAERRLGRRHLVSPLLAPTKGAIA